MITEKGILPVGIERDGQVHREFEVRPALVDDAISVAQEHTALELRNEVYYGVCLAAKQVVRIGEITPVFVSHIRALTDLDFKEIGAARKRLEKRLLSFRNDEGKGERSAKSRPVGEDKGSEEAASLAPETSDTDGDGA